MLIEKIVKNKWIIYSVILLVAGIGIGLLFASSLDWLPLGHTTQQKTISSAVTEQLSQTSQAFAEIVKAVTPSVVNISTTKIVKRGTSQLSPFFDDPFFKDFFGNGPFHEFRLPKKWREQSLGSGVIVSQDGYILTNNHVIGKADEIKVSFSDKREFKGKLIGADSKTDIAVIKIDAKDLPTVRWGDSDKLQVGEFVLAIGNPFGLNQTVTMGIISAVGRANVGIADYEDFIQTDAAINPGNSGGALVNIKGELIGINTAIFSRSGGYQGIGFAVPSNMAKDVMDGLIKKGKVVRGWLGVTIQEVTPELAAGFGLKNLKGAIVSDISRGSSAEKAGIKRGDIITMYNGKEIESVGQLRNAVAKTPVGAEVKIVILRDKKEKELLVTIGELPKEIAREGLYKDRHFEEEGVSSVFGGITVKELTPNIASRLGISKDERGVVVTSVESDSAAEESGIRKGDVIQEIDKKEINSLKDYTRIVSRLKKNETVLLLINRGGRKFYVTLKSLG
ncbi:MAG: DegQ family serine endoprotease [Nitrospirota bacterium]